MHLKVELADSAPTGSSEHRGVLVLGYHLLRHKPERHELVIVLTSIDISLKNTYLTKCQNCHCPISALIQVYTIYEASHSLPLKFAVLFLCSLRSRVFVLCPLTGGGCLCGHLPPHPPPVTYMATPTAAPGGIRMGEPGPMCRETTHVRICLRMLLTVNKINCSRQGHTVQAGSSLYISC